MEKKFEEYKDKSNVDYPTIEERLEDFEEEIESLGDKFEKEIEKTGERFEKKYTGTFGILGPLIWSLIGLLAIGIVIWAFNNLGNAISSPMFINIGDFLLEYIGIFFFLLLFFNYSSYLLKRYGENLRYVSPLITALAVSIWAWILSEILLILNENLGISELDNLVNLVQSNIYLLFMFVLVFGYIIMILNEGKKTYERRSENMSDIEYYQGKSKKNTRRFYRSGKEKILGGVCGGFAEHFEIDLLLVRILWVIIAFASLGTAILLYIILWIIMPRNPNHKW